MNMTTRVFLNLLVDEAIHYWMHVYNNYTLITYTD